MKKLKIIIFSITLVIVNISCKNSRVQKCDVQEMKTLFTTPGIYEGKVTGYAHYTLVKDFSRQCMDSTTMVNLALQYSDTVSVGNPADLIMIFNSDKDFIPNETSQVMAKINKSCLVVIGLDVKSKKLKDFIFYNDNGERLYWGDRWLPLGE